MGRENWNIENWKKAITITIDRDVLKALRQVADDENRNLSNMVEKLVKEGLERRNTWKKQDS